MSSGEASAANWFTRLPPLTSLSWRLAAWSAATSMLIVLAVSVALYGAMVAQVRSVDEQVLMKRALRVGDILQTPSDIAFWLPHEVSEDLEGPRQVFMRVLDGGGALVNETPRMSDVTPTSLFLVAANPRSARPNTFSNAHEHQFRGLSLRLQAAGLPGGQATVQTAVDMSVDEILLGRFRQTLLAVTIPAMFAAALVAAFVAATLLAPLRRMAREAEAVGVNDINARLSSQAAADEVGDVERAFNAALDRLQHAHEGLRRYADNVAHEIRTPLNRMLLTAEIAAREPRTEAEYREIIEAQARECGALARLAQRLLFLARAENTPVPLERAELNVQHECTVLLTYFESSAADAGVALTLDCASPDWRILADRTLFQQAIGNLVENALTHTPRGGGVCIAVRLDAPYVEVAVTDAGGGIAPDELPHVFDRFYRASRERPGKSNGVGLGLAIAKSILALHHGSIAIESELGKGTTARTRWPRP